MADRARTRRLVAAAIGAVLLASCQDAVTPTDTTDGVVGDAAPATPDRAASGEAPPPAAPGPTVPSVAATAFDGRTVNLSEHRTTPMVVNFWASWCAPCVAELPDLQAVSQRAGDRVTFVGVNTQDTPATAADLADQSGITYDLVRDPDGTLFRAFGVLGMPSTFYVAADGTIVDRHTGLLTAEALLDDLAEHLGVDLDTGSEDADG